MRSAHRRKKRIINHRLRCRKTNVRRRAGIKRKIMKIEVYNMGDIVRIQYLYRNKLRTESWRWNNYNKNTKEYWFFNDTNAMLCVKEGKLIAIEKAPDEINDVR